MEKLLAYLYEDPARLAFNAPHLVEKIEGVRLLRETYAKEKVKTSSVALVLCLNINVQPPDVHKISPYSKVEAWFDTTDASAYRALDTIGKELQAQYERHQTRSRVKQCLDPNLDDVKKLCTQLRRSAKSDRILFHYNGHGVPSPTENGEIWVFNKDFTKYIPLTLADLQRWLGAPAFYIFDCNHAGRNIRSYEKFSRRRQESAMVEQSQRLMDPQDSRTRRRVSVLQQQQLLANGAPFQSGMDCVAPVPVPVTMENSILLAACHESEQLPQHPDVPADLFTACLVTPIKMALKWHWIKNNRNFPGYLDEALLARIPGNHSHRTTALGEINWIFTAVTDTIAWCSFPMDSFQRLFRQDPLVATLFRNFLLAQRIMHFYGCTPQSAPPLPNTNRHEMWDAWDHALDRFVHYLPQMLGNTIEGSLGPEKIALPILKHETADPYQFAASMGRADLTPMERRPSAQKGSLGGHLVSRQQMLAQLSRENQPSRPAMDSSLLDPKKKQALPRRKSTLVNLTEEQHEQLHTVAANLRFDQDLRLTTDPGKEDSFSSSVMSTSNSESSAVSSPVAPQERRSPPHVDARTERSPPATMVKKGPRKQQPKLVQLLMQQQQQQNVRLTGLRPMGFIWSNSTTPVLPSAPKMTMMLSSNAPVGPVSFFASQMTAFKVWLRTADEHKPLATQLPILLQVLLSQSHRIRALQLLSEFLDLGPWAVAHCITVGIFPYIVRLFRAIPADVRPHLVLIWASAQMDFCVNESVRQSGYEYFSACLADEANLNALTRIVSAFALAKMLLVESTGKVEPSFQKVYRDQGYVVIVVSILRKCPPGATANDQIRLRQWLIFGLARYWQTNVHNYRQALHEGLLKLLEPHLKDVSLLVRAATVFALGTFMENGATDAQLRSDPQAELISLDIGMKLVAISLRDPSHLVRSEVIVALKWLVLQCKELFLRATKPKPSSRGEDASLPVNDQQSRRSSTENKPGLTEEVKRIWNGLTRAVRDPHPQVAALAKRLVTFVRHESLLCKKSNSYTNLTKSCDTTVISQLQASPQLSPSEPVFEAIDLSDMDSTISGKDDRDQAENVTLASVSSIDKLRSCDAIVNEIKTDFFAWSSKWFTKPLLDNAWMDHEDVPDTFALYPRRTPSGQTSQKLNAVLAMMGSLGGDSDAHLFSARHERQKRQLDVITQGSMAYAQLAETATSCQPLESGPPVAGSSVRRRPTSMNVEESRIPVMQQLRNLRNRYLPRCVTWHPFANHLAVADDAGVTIWDVEQGAELQCLVNKSSRSGETWSVSCVTGTEFINVTEDSEATLLLTTSADGCVRVWRDYTTNNPQIVAAWPAFTELLQSQRPAGLIHCWNARSRRLAVAGDAAKIRLYDTQREEKLFDFTTHEQSCVSCINVSNDDRLLVAGFGSGFVKIFDTRAKPDDAIILSRRVDNGWLNSVAFTGDHTFYVTGYGGTLEAVRLAEGGKAVKERQMKISSGMTFCASLKVDSPNTNHHLVAAGSGGEVHEVAVYLAGMDEAVPLSKLRFLDGFARENIANPTCVSFHPFEPQIAVGLQDNSLLVLKLANE